MDIHSQLKNIIDQEKLFFDKASISKYARSTLQKGTTPAGIVMPESSEEIQKIVDLANEQEIGLYPISRGRNWGYGDACAVQDGQVILDLSNMNKIIEVNQDLAYAVIEPGVTQSQLHELLKEKNGHYGWTAQDPAQTPVS